jgi:hypothetical protein
MKTLKTLLSGTPLKPRNDSVTLSNLLNHSPDPSQQTTSFLSQASLYNHYSEETKQFFQQTTCEVEIGLHLDFNHPSAVAWQMQDFCSPSYPSHRQSDTTCSPLPHSDNSASNLSQTVQEASYHHPYL